MTSHLTIEDPRASTQAWRENFAGDLDATADLPNENTTDLDAGPVRETRLAEPRLAEPVVTPLDEQPFAPMPKQRALGFFAFATCALVAILGTTEPRGELSVSDTPPPTQVAPVNPISSEIRPVAADSITLTHATRPHASVKPSPTVVKPKPAEAIASTSLITFASRSFVTSEKSIAAVFIIKRPKAATGKAAVRWAARSGSADAGIDFSDASGTVTFADGQRQLAIYVPLRNDLLKEGDETFKVCLRSPQQARIAGGSCAETTIIDDDSVTPT